MDTNTAALLIDWENIKFSTLKNLNSPPDVIILKKIARRYGTLKLARAFANWADMQHEGDMERFSFQNIEPIYVQTRRFVDRENQKQVVKGAADIRLACDCMELLLQNPQIDTFVLASGDAGFEHLVQKISTHGKRSVMISVRGTTGMRLGVVSDEVVWYDDWISGLKGGLAQAPIQDALLEFQRAVEDIRRGKGPNDLQSVKRTMQKRNPAFEEEEIGLPTFRHLAHLAEMKGLVKIDATVTPAKAYLSEEKTSDEGIWLHIGTKWRKFVKALEPNMAYPFFTLVKIIQEAGIYQGDGEIKEFIGNVLQSGVLWHKPSRFHNISAGELRNSRHYYLDPTHPKVQVYSIVEGLDGEARPPSGQATAPAGSGGPGSR